MNKEIEERSFDFSIRIAELVQFLRTDKLGFPLCDRLLSCGVLAGLACRELGTDEKGRKKTVKEVTALVTEADYIIEMASVAGYLTMEQSVHIRADCKSLLELLAGE